MKKWIALCIVVLLSFSQMKAEASNGSVEVQLPEGTEYGIFYIKVADMINGLWELEDIYEESKVNVNTIKNAEELQMTAEKLLDYINEKQISMNEKTGQSSVLLNDLEEGLYLIAFEKSDKMEALPTLVSLPGWIEEEPTYHVVLMPKFVEKKSAPQTGWDSREGLYAGLLGICFVVIVKLQKNKHRFYSK